MSRRPWRQISLLGCRVDAVTQRQALDRIAGWRTEGDRKSHVIITINAAILMMMRSNAALAEALGRADMVLIDGAPVLWASRWLGQPAPEKVSGIDLMEQLLAEGARSGLRVYFLGTTRERLARLLEVVRARYAGLEVVGARDGYFGDAETPALLNDIRASGADLLLLGMPAPMKEIWCEKHRDALQTPAILGVGGAFDVVAGFLPRAPVFMQNGGLEWAWRLALEPRKLWRRNLVTNSQFLCALAVALVRRWRWRLPRLARPE